MGSKMSTKDNRLGCYIAHCIEAQLDCWEHMTTHGLATDKALSRVVKAAHFNTVQGLLAALRTSGIDVVLCEIVMVSWGNHVANEDLKIATGRTRDEWLQVERSWRT